MCKKFLALLLALVLAMGVVGVAWATGSEPEQPGEEVTEPGEETPDPAAYTVSFHTGEGSTVESQTVTEGETAAPPADPVREGYTFDGWFADEALTEPFDFATPVYADMTLYAAWTEIAPPPVPVAEFTVTFDADGGSEVSAQTVVGGDTAERPEDPVREGYIFLNWVLDGVAYDFDTPVDSDITLLAIWEEDHEGKTYTVSFDTGEGSGVESQTVAWGETAARPGDPARSGWTFDGWFVDAALAVPYDFASPVTGDITLYARWKVVAPVNPTSVDIRLSYLSIECGELRPAFSPDVYSYTVYVTADQENRSCRILCDTISHDARVEAEGSQTVGSTDVVRKIRVAGGGRYAEYTVVVHVLTFRERLWDGQLYSITDRPNTSMLPGTFTVGQITINGEKVSAAQSTDGQLLLVQFTSQADGTGSYWYRYEQDRRQMYPVSIVEIDREHYIRVDEGNTLLYGSEAGVGTFYVYDPNTGEITYQTKDYDELSVNLIPTVIEKTFPGWPVTIALIAWGVLATAAAFYLLRRSRHSKKKSVYFRPVFSADEGGSEGDPS